MPPAARIGDMHTCPMVNPGPVPHVGGPVSVGAPTVQIGFMPAARQGDMCVCVGPPDTIAMGSPTVQICGMPAARMGDPTAHGGVVTVGFPTVMIGVVGAGGGTTPASPVPALKPPSWPPSLKAPKSPAAKQAQSPEEKKADFKGKAEGSVGVSKGPLDGKAQGEAKVKLGVKLEKSAALKEWGNEDNFLKFGSATGHVGTGYEYDAAEGKHTVSVVQLGGKVAVAEAQLKGKGVKGLTKGELAGEVLSASVDVTPLAVVWGKDTALVKSEIGAEAVLVKGSAKGQLNITGKTVYDNTVGRVVGHFSPDSPWVEAADWADHGIVAGLEGEAGIAAAAKASAHAGVEDGVYKVGGELKLGAGPMAGLKGFIGVK